LSLAATGSRRMGGVIGDETLYQSTAIIRRKGARRWTR
jgi:hypothetical protein